MKKGLSILTAVAVTISLVTAGNGAVSTTATAKVKKQTVSITVGATKKLQGPKAYKKSKLQWKSSKKAVVTVNKNGKIKGVAAGKADITAKTTGKKSKVVAKFKVKVLKKKSKVTASPAATQTAQVTTNSAVTVKPTATQAPAVTQSAAPAATQMPTQTPQVSPFDNNTPSIHLMYNTTESKKLINSLSVDKELSGKVPAVVEDLQKFDEEYFRWHTTALIAVPITYGYDVSLDSVQEDGKNMTISLKAQNTVKDDQVVQTVMETKYILAELSHGLPNIEEISVQMTNYNNDGTVEKEKREICKTTVEARILPE